MDLDCYALQEWIWLVEFVGFTHIFQRLANLALILQVSFWPQFHSSQKVLSSSWPTICMVSNATVGCGFKHFLLFSPGKLGKMNPFWLLHIFQTGWFNHQLEYSTKKPCFVPPLSWWCFLFSRMLQGKKQHKKPGSDNSTTRGFSFCGSPAGIIKAALSLHSMVVTRLKKKRWRFEAWGDCFGY